MSVSAAVPGLSCWFSLSSKSLLRFLHSALLLHCWRCCRPWTWQAWHPFSSLLLWRRIRSCLRNRSSQCGSSQMLGTRICSYLLLLGCFADFKCRSQCRWILLVLPWSGGQGLLHMFSSFCLGPLFNTPRIVSIYYLHLCFFSPKKFSLFDNCSELDCHC